MFFIFPTLFHYFIMVMSAFFSLISNYYFGKLLLFTVWVLLSFRINVFWLIERKKRNPLLIMIDHLSYMNIFVTATCIEVELIWTFFIEWPFGDILCRITKWLQTTSLIISAALILQIVIFLKYPEKNRKHIKKNLLIMWLAGLFFASPQLSIFGTYTIAPSNITQCTVEQSVPESYEEIVRYLKMTYFAATVIALLTAHSFLYCLFMGKKKQIFWGKHAKDKWTIMKIYLMMVLYTYCAFFALSVLSLYVRPIGIIVEYFHYGLLQAGCLFSTFNPFLLRKILEKSASDDTDDGIASSSSPPPFNLVSIQLSDDPPTSSLDSVSIPISDDNDGISSSPPLNSVSIQLSDDLPSSSLESVSVQFSDDNDGISTSTSLNTVSIMLSGDENALNVAPDKERKRNMLSSGDENALNVAPDKERKRNMLSGGDENALNVASDKERKRNTWHYKMKRLIVYNTLNPSVVV